MLELFTLYSAGPIQRCPWEQAEDATLPIESPCPVQGPCRIAGEALARHDLPHNYQVTAHKQAFLFQIKAYST